MKFCNDIGSGILAICAVLFGISCSQDKLCLPQGWRMPDVAEISNSWRSEDMNKYLIVKGDFNADSVTDEARLLVHVNGDRFGLFAFVSREDGRFRNFMLDEKEDINALKAMGIAKVPPGRYETACGKGFVDCAENESTEIELQHVAINYFKHGSANMFYYWDELSNSFKAVGIND